MSTLIKKFEIEVYIRHSQVLTLYLFLDGCGIPSFMQTFVLHKDIWEQKLVTGYRYNVKSDYILLY